MIPIPTSKELLLLNIGALCISVIIVVLSSTVFKKWISKKLTKNNLFDFITLYKANDWKEENYERRSVFDIAIAIKRAITIAEIPRQTKANLSDLLLPDLPDGVKMGLTGNNSKVYDSIREEYKKYWFYRGYDLGLIGKQQVKLKKYAEKIRKRTVIILKIEHIFAIVFQILKVLAIIASVLLVLDIVLNYFKVIPVNVSLVLIMSAIIIDILGLLIIFFSLLVEVRNRQLVWKMAKRTVICKEETGNAEPQHKASLSFNANHIIADDKSKELMKQLQQAIINQKFLKKNQSIAEIIAIQQVINALVMTINAVTSIELMTVATAKTFYTKTDFHDKVLKLTSKEIKDTDKLTNEVIKFLKSKKTKKRYLNIKVDVDFILDAWINILDHVLEEYQKTKKLIEWQLSKKKNKEN